MEIGYIKLHRQLLNWEWYDDINVFRLFTHLLLKTNYEPKKWHGIYIGIGQFLTSRETLAKQTGLTEQQVRTALTKLKSTNEITSQSTNNYTLITITNWEKWQQNNHPINNQSTSLQPTDNQPSTTTKERKKERNKENYNDQFSAFWDLYPRKVAKAKAEQIFIRIMKGGADYESIIRGVKNYNEKCRGKDEEFIAHASTWLNGERWKDEKTNLKKLLTLEEMKEKFL